MRSAALTWLVIAALATCLGAQAPTWQAEFLGGPQPGWSTVWVVAVNDAGTVAGNTYINGYKHAWIGAPGEGLELLPLPAGATWAEVDDMNAAGVVAGSIGPAGGGLQGVVWRPGPAGYEVLVVPNGPGNLVAYDARGINDDGDVVGKLGVFGGSYVWNVWSGSIVQITTQAFPVVPEDINNQRQIVGDTYRMDLDTMVLEDLGNPTGTTYGFMYTKLGTINDAGECTGYAVTATSGWPYLPVRYTDGPTGPTWKVFSNFPLQAAGAGGIAATGDTVFQLGIYGTYVYVNGVGSIALQSTLDPVSADWDLTDSFLPAISRCGRLACNGFNSVTGDAGIVLLTPFAFEDLGGAAAGALGDPVLTGYGSLLPHTPVRVRFASAAQDSLSILALSVVSSPVPLLGGMFHANPALVFLSLPTDGLGRWEFAADWPDVPEGVAVYLQAAVVDSGAVFGKSLSNGLEAVTR